MKETEVGYRGSKSIMNNFIVKEQRVDGSSWRVSILHLRCTLKGFEGSYQDRILSLASKKISLQRFFSSKVQQSFEEIHNLSSINPSWFTGFIDGEGCFSIGISKNKNKVG